LYFVPQEKYLASKGKHKDGCDDPALYDDELVHCTLFLLDSSLSGSGFVPQTFN